MNVKKLKNFFLSPNWVYPAALCYFSVFFEIHSKIWMNFSLVVIGIYCIGWTLRHVRVI